MANDSDRLATALRELLEAAHAEVSPRYSERMEDAFSNAENALAARQAQDGDVSYEVWQNDMSVAGAQGPGALQEAMHYAAQYALDGPVEVYKVTRERIHPTPPPQQEPQS